MIVYFMKRTKRYGWEAVSSHRLESREMSRLFTERQRKLLREGRIVQKWGHRLAGNRFCITNRI